MLELRKSLLSMIAVADHDRNDILVKAQQMEIKIWTVEKLQRILDALYHVDPAAQQSLQRHGHGRGTREAELSEMLRNERRQAAQDRDWMTEMVPFKGYYVYVHDMNERTKPIMVRDYPRVASKEQGKWPQFRVAPPGRSPFTEDHQVTKTSTAPAGRAAERPKALTRAATTTFASQRLNHGRALEELPNPPVVARKPGDAQPRSHIRNDSADFLPTFGTAQATLRGAARVPFQGFGRRLVQGEPVASGIQPSNITSAVRSQIVSSAAVGPGGKAGSTRELNVLNRKMIAGKNLAQKKPVVTEESKPAKRNLNCIAEEEDDQRRTRPRKKRAVEKETKSGYCENCHEKFDDFDEVSACLC
jgi:regulatory subunit for Cdc7p protein kinase